MEDKLKAELSRRFLAVTEPQDPTYIEESTTEEFISVPA
jgi:hypothetical protein